MRIIDRAMYAHGIVLSFFALACGSTETTPITHATTATSASSVTSSVASSAMSSAASSGSGGSGGADPCVARAASIQTLLDSTLPMTGSPGAVLAVTTPDCGKWVGATGQSTSVVAMKPDDVLRIGSITKTFVATTVLELVGENKVSLEDALEKWLPGFPNGANITIRELLNHTSGIFNFTDDPMFDMTENADPMTKWTPQQLVDVAAMNMPYDAPGQSFHYSNTNYILLGMLIEKITADTIGKEIQTRLLDKQNLTSTSFEGEEPIKGTLAHGYLTSGTDVATAFDPSYAWSAGAMISSVADLADWASALYGGSVLSPNLLMQMETGAVATDQEGVQYGLGVFVFSAAVANDIAYGHLGDIPGYHSQMFYFPNEKIAVADIVNSDKGTPNPISAAVIELLVDPNP